MSVGVWRKQVFNSRKEENFPTAGVVQKLMAVVVRPVRDSVQDENRARAPQPHRQPPQIKSLSQRCLKISSTTARMFQALYHQESQDLCLSRSHRDAFQSASNTHPILLCLPFFLIPYFTHCCVYSHRYFRATFMKSLFEWSRFL